VIPSKNPQTAEQQRGRHFQIKFDPDRLAYFIKDLGIGHGVFVKQEGPTVSFILPKSTIFTNNNINIK
jgi:hypothetical protein